ncbi:MAG: DeoR/GlpR transcriptional regulator [Chloroflexi bacterium]|jgi:DeoR family fructose operon transcriptional repressor|nr:DeoR/GlpR family DNA-binding transcription regulator [Anaerolineaceae bacterium]NMB88431.1 DeoR/GlpR transcriptional regulator [Chloroflexota bacterium]
MFSIERQSLILELLEQEGKVEVNALASKFSTSKETIRRDLKEMEAAGILNRMHGGAVAVAPKRSEGYELPLLARGVQKYEEKQRICKATAQLLEDGDTIFLDNSSTTMGLLRYVPKNIKITVLTNSIQVMLEAGKLNNENIVVISVGGMLNVKNYSIVGALTKSFAQNFFPDKAIMSCRGIEENSGMTEANILEIDLKRDMMTRSKQFILLADHTKFGLIGAVFLGSLSEVDCVITDPKTDRTRLKMFEDLNTRIIISE